MDVLWAVQQWVRGRDGGLPPSTAARARSRDWRVHGAQVCLPVKNLDLGYNLVRTHDGSAAFLIVDHDEEEMITARAPIGNIYAPGA